MPSIRFRAPLLALSDLVTLAVLTLRERRAGQTLCPDGEGLGHTHTVIRLPAEEAHDACRPAHRTVPRPLPRHPRTPGGGCAGSGRPRPGRPGPSHTRAGDRQRRPSGAVVAGDDEVDRRYLDIERQVVDLLGRHAPVASDLRLLTAILHINLHLERIGDMAVNVARLGQVVADAPRSRRWIRHLEQMSDTAVWMVELAMQAFGARDAPGSQRLPGLDARVDELNRSLLAAVLAPRQPLDQLAWVVYVHDAGRQLERAADHAVDIAEQVWFLVTGELREFDSAPSVPAPTS